MTGELNDAVIRALYEAWAAASIPPGPCPAVKDFGHEGVGFNGNTEPKQLRALCDLRAGHAGQHEAEDEQWGYFRWTDTSQPGQAGCRRVSHHEVAGRWLTCVLGAGHDDLHRAFFGEETWTW